MTQILRTAPVCWDIVSPNRALSSQRDRASYPKDVRSHRNVIRMMIAFLVNPANNDHSSDREYRLPTWPYHCSLVGDGARVQRVVSVSVRD